MTDKGPENMVRSDSRIVTSRAFLRGCVGTMLQSQSGWRRPLKSRSSWLVARSRDTVSGVHLPPRQSRCARRLFGKNGSVYGRLSDATDRGWAELFSASNTAN